MLYIWINFFSFLVFVFDSFVSTSAPFRVFPQTMAGSKVSFLFANNLRCTLFAVHLVTDGQILLLELDFKINVNDTHKEIEEILKYKLGCI